MRHRVISLLFLPIQALAATYTVSQISYYGCTNATCAYKITNGDTTVFSAWGSGGTTTFNGSPVSGATYGTVNDSNIAWRADTTDWGPNCSTSGNIVWLQATSIDTTGTNGGGVVAVKNCMNGYGNPDSGTWSPAASGACNVGSVSGCSWKSNGDICVDGVCYWNILRSDGTYWRYYDSTLIKTSDGGTSWLNPAHVGGGPDVSGDTPAGPGDASYPASILWPDQSPYDGSTQKMGRLQFIVYGQDGATWPNVDNNGIYVYALATAGDFSNYYLARVVRANMPYLATSDWSYYACPGYSTAVCDGMSSGSWSSSLSSATPLPPLSPTTLGYGGMVYVSQLGTYLMVSGDKNTNVFFNTAPHPWGPFTLSATLSGNPVSGAHLGFVTPMMATLTTISSNAVQLTFSSNAYNYDGSGTTAWVTYQVASTFVPSNIGGMVRNGKTVYSSWYVH